MKPTPRRAFTLTELLVSMAIIGILALIIISAFNKVQVHTAYVTASNDVRNIANAWRLYYADRGRWPDPQHFEPKGPDGRYLVDAKSSERADGEVFWNAYVRLLTGRFEPGQYKYEELLEYNPSKETYLFIDESQIDGNGEFVDPWGRPYKFKLDKLYQTNSEGDLYDAHIIGDMRIGRFSYDHYGPPDNPRPGQIVIEDIAIAWSRGPNGNDHNPEEAKGDPTSW